MLEARVVREDFGPYVAEYDTYAHEADERGSFMFVSYGFQMWRLKRSQLALFASFQLQYPTRQH